MTTVEEQAKELREHRDELDITGLGFFFALTYGSVIAAFQQEIKAVLKNKDGSDANLSWQDNMPFVLRGWRRACSMHQYDDKVDPQSFATDWYELTREEYRNEKLVLGYSKDAEKLYLKIAKSYFDATGGKVRSEDEDDAE
jgi:hypothetical protein